MSNSNTHRRKTKTGFYQRKRDRVFQAHFEWWVAYVDYCNYDRRKSVIDALIPDPVWAWHGSSRVPRWRIVHRRVHKKALGGRYGWHFFKVRVNAAMNKKSVIEAEAKKHRAWLDAYAKTHSQRARFTK